MGINLKEHGWGKASSEEKTFTKLPPGGYVCKIFDAHLETIKEKGLRLTCDVDIDEGEFKGYFSRRNGMRGWDFNAQFVRYVLREDGRANPYFEKFIALLEKENKNFKFDENDFEADQLRALKCGFTFGEKEYLDKNKNLRTTVNIRFPEPIQKIRDGNFKIPPPQKLPEEKIKYEQAAKEFEEDSTPIDPNDLPF